MERDTERAVYVQHIDPEHKQAYVDAHNSVPTGVEDAMERGTVREFELYVRDDVAVCILEAEDLDAYRDEVTGDPVVERWERHVAEFKRDGVDVDAPDEDQIPFMNEIWSFRPRE